MRAAIIATLEPLSREHSADVTPVAVEVIPMAFVRLAASAAPGLALERPEFQGDLLHEGVQCLPVIGGGFSTDVGVRRTPSASIPSMALAWAMAVSLSSAPSIFGPVMTILSVASTSGATARRQASNAGSPSVDVRDGRVGGGGELAGGRVDGGGSMLETVVASSSS